MSWTVKNFGRQDDGSFEYIRFGSGAAPSPFCDWIDYEQVFEIGGLDSTFVRNEINKQYSITTTGGDFKGFNFSSPANGFVSESSKVSFELEAVSITNQPSGGAVFLFQDQPSPEIIAGFFNQAGTIIDALGSILGGATYQTGYIMGMTFDFATGTALASDNAFLLNNPLTVGTYAPDAPLYHGWIGASLAATTNIFSPNSGDRPFVLPQSDGVGFCNVVPIPPPVLCSPVTLTTQAGVPPNQIQDITVGGTNNLTITATSLGNNVINSGAVANQVFNTQTEEVKIETRITSMPSTFISNAPAVGIGFFHNVLPLGSIPVLITNLTYIPILNQVIGTNGTPYNVYPVPSYPTDLAIYLDSATGQSQAKFYNALNNLSWFPNIGVGGGYNNLQDVYMAISVNAGDATGQSVVQTINFGSSAFELGEDAERWCNV
jgi:hypothetical protein